MDWPDAAACGRLWKTGVRLPVFQGLVGSGGWVCSCCCFEAVHGFPQPDSVHRPLGAKRRGSCFPLGGVLGGGLGSAYRGAFELEAVGVVEEAIADGVGQVGIADDAMPVLGL
jgi:hypothetical protein